MMFSPGCCNCTSAVLTIGLEGQCGASLPGVVLGVTIGNSPTQYYTSGSDGGTKLPGIPPGTTITITASLPPRYAENSITYTTPSNGNSSTIRLILPAAAGFACIGCSHPVSKLLTLQTPFGGGQISWNQNASDVPYGGAFNGSFAPWYAPVGSQGSSTPYYFGKNATATNYGFVIYHENPGFEADNVTLNCPPATCPTQPLVSFMTQTVVNHQPGPFAPVTVTENIDGCTDPTSGGNTASALPMQALAPFQAATLVPASTLRVGLILDWLLLGGAEASMLAQVDAISTILGSAVTWIGAAVMNGPADASMLADYSALMPVTVGGPTAARTLAAQCDVVLTWSVLDYAALYAGLTTPPKTVFECHLPSAWGGDSARMLGTVDAFVAVSQYAQAPIPTALAGRSSVIWNAIDTARLTTARSRATVQASWGITS